MGYGLRFTDEEAGYVDLAIMGLTDIDPRNRATVATMPLIEDRESREFKGVASRTWTLQGTIWPYPRAGSAPLYPIPDSNPSLGSLNRLFEYLDTATDPLVSLVVREGTQERAFPTAYYVEEWGWKSRVLRGNRRGIAWRMTLTEDPHSKPVTPIPTVANPGDGSTGDVGGVG